MPLVPSGANGVRLPESNAVNASTMNSSSTPSLTNTITVLARALSRKPAISSAGDREHEERGGQVDDAALARRLGDRVRQREAERGVEQLVEVAAPADRHGGHRDAVLEHEVPADDPRDQLAHRRVRVRVGASPATGIVEASSA